MEIALLGERFDARCAFEWGLVNRVVPASVLASSTRSWALRLAAGPTRALGRTKRLINQSLSQTLPDQLLAEQDAFSACTVDVDFARGLQAFLEKREPVFCGI